MNGYERLLSAFARWIVLESPHWLRYYPSWHEGYQSYVTNETCLKTWAWTRLLADQKRTGEEL